VKPRFVFIHGNHSTHWSFAWTPWLKAELEKLGFETFFETFPDSIIAREEYWIPFLQDHIKAGENDVLIGWSSGATASMRYAESHKIKGSVLVSPCYTDLDDEMEKLSGYYNRPWEWDKIRENQGKIAVVYSNNDPYISEEDFNFIATQLRAEKYKVPQAQHFIEAQQIPEIIEHIKATYVA
jgi:predicted alpha/beta hydrolase family esterase